MAGCLNDDPFKVPSSSRRIINLFNLALWTMEDGGETIIPFIMVYYARYTMETYGNNGFLTMGARIHTLTYTL